MNLHTLTWRSPDGPLLVVYGSWEAVSELWDVLAGAGVAELEIVPQREE